MEELLVEKYRYTFTLSGNRRFTALFIKIDANSQISTLHVSDYTDENGIRGNYGSYLKIYGKRDATRTKTADGRTTYWDSNIQV